MDFNLSALAILSYMFTFSHIPLIAYGCWLTLWMDHGGVLVRVRASSR